MRVVPKVQVRARPARIPVRSRTIVLTLMAAVRTTREVLVAGLIVRAVLVPEVFAYAAAEPGSCQGHE